jgi:hypothetical protein
MVIELQVIAGAGFRSPRPKSVGLGQNLPGHDGSKSRAARAREDRCHKPSPVALRQIGTTGKIPLRQNPKSVAYLRPSRSDKRGGRASSRTRDGMWWTRQRRREIAAAGRVEPRERSAGAQDERRQSVRQNRVVLTPVAGAKSAVACSNPTGIEGSLKSADDGDKTNSSPGRARHKP